MSTVTVTETEARRALARLGELRNHSEWLIAAGYIPSSYVREWERPLQWHEQRAMAETELREARVERQSALDRGDAEGLSVANARVQANEYRLAEVNRNPVGAPAMVDLRGVQRELDRLKGTAVPGRPRALTHLREENRARAGRGWHGISLGDLPDMTEETVEIIDKWVALVKEGRAWAVAQRGLVGQMSNPHTGPRALDLLEEVARVIGWGRRLAERAAALEPRMAEVGWCRPAAGSRPLSLGDPRALEAAA